jgi:hypothetical protein
MGISAARLNSDAVDTHTTDLVLHIVLADGRELDAPLEWFPRVRDATPEPRRHWRPDINEDRAVPTLLRSG